MLIYANIRKSKVKLKPKKEREEYHDICVQTGRNGAAKRWGLDRVPIGFDSKESKNRQRQYRKR